MAIFAVYPEDSLTLNQIAEHVLDYKIQFPVVKDWEQKLASKLQATRLSQVVVLDGNLNIRYQGEVDDQYSIEGDRPKAMQHELTDSLEAILNDQKIPITNKPASGCVITKPKTRSYSKTLNYIHDIAPIIQSNCMTCHRPGAIAPFPLLTFENVKSWAPMIREVVLEQRMPPWHASEKSVPFKNNRSLSAENRQLIIDWIDQGAERGEGQDVVPPVMKDEWLLGKPDLVLTPQKPTTVPASGTSYFTNIVLDPKFNEDHWISAVDIKAGNPQVLHHVALILADGELAPDTPWTYFAPYTPSVNARVFDPGTAKLIPAHKKIVMFIHYTPRGKEETDLTKIGLYFSKEKNPKQVFNLLLGETKIDIPAHAPEVEMWAKKKIDAPIQILSVFPHAHFRGKSFRFYVVDPKGKRELLLSVPRFDFGWQYEYTLKKPYDLKAGSSVECEAHFDNSERNLRNPDPSKEVHWGEDSTDEMMYCYMDYLQK